MVAKLPACFAEPGRMVATASALALVLVATAACRESKPVPAADAVSTSAVVQAAATPRSRITITRTTKLPSHIAVNDGAVYVTEVDTNDEQESADIVRLSLDGGTRTVVATAQPAGQSIVATPDALYWLVKGNADRNQPDSVVRASLAVGKPEKVGETFLFTDAGLAWDGDALYFCELRDKSTRMMRLPVRGGKASLVAAYGYDSVRAIAVDATNVYWLVTADIVRAPKTGGAASMLAKVDNVWGLATDGAHLYWTDKGQGTRGSGTVSRMPVGGGAIERLAGGLTLPWGIAVDSTHVYWVTNADRDGALMRRSKVNGPVETLVRNLDAPVHLALDAGHVYWTNAGGKTVQKVAK